MTDTQDLGHCRVCGFEWVIAGGASLWSDDDHGDNAGGLHCPACGSDNVQIKKEEM